MKRLRNENYTVRPGDTLWKIAGQYQIGLTELINANPQIENPDMIYIGQQVNIPSLNDFRDMEREIIRLVNEERSRRGINPLTEDWEISRVARIKSQDMVENNYFSHNSPVYGSPFDMLSAFGVRYTQAAENIAYGQRTATQVVNTWMNSTGHRNNILNRNYNLTGVGVARDGRDGPLYFTQIFVRR